MTNQHDPTRPHLGTADWWRRAAKERGLDVASWWRTTFAEPLDLPADETPVSPNETPVSHKPLT